MNASANLNDFVWVKLTGKGRAVYSQYKSSLGITPAILATLTHNSTEVREFMKFQLWTLMSIFGSFAFVGGDALFYNNTIHFVDPNHPTSP